MGPHQEARAARKCSPGLDHHLTGTELKKKPKLLAGSWPSLPQLGLKNFSTHPLTPSSHEVHKGQNHRKKTLVTLQAALLFLPLYAIR